MFLDFLGLHRPEGVKPDVQRDQGQPDAVLPQPQQQLRGEVQPGRGRSHGAFDPAVDGLVALGIGQRLVDVGGQRHLAGAPEPPFDGRIEGDEPAAGRRAAEDGRRGAPGACVAGALAAAIA